MGSVPRGRDILASRRTTFRALFEILVLLLALLASTLIVWELWARRAVIGRNSSVLKVPASPLSLDGAPYKGSAEATAVMIIYSDFQCPFCATFARDTLPKIEADYVDTGLLAIAFRNMPLEPIHALAFQAATAGLCANQQGRFWAWHDSLFAVGLRPDGDAMTQAAITAGVGSPEFSDCIQRGITSAQVRRELQEAQALGMRSTPTFVFGIRERGAVQALATLSGARPLREFKSAIDQVVARSREP